MDDINVRFRLKPVDGRTPNENQYYDPFKFTEQFLQLYSEWEHLVFKTASEHIIIKMIGHENKRRIHIEISTNENPNKKEPYSHE
jgi:hypothetical protein